MELRLKQGEWQLFVEFFFPNGETKITQVWSRNLDEVAVPKRAIRFRFYRRYIGLLTAGEEPDDEQIAVQGIGVEDISQTFYYGGKLLKRAVAEKDYPKKYQALTRRPEWKEKRWRYVVLARNNQLYPFSIGNDVVIPLHREDLPKSK